MRDRETERERRLTEEKKRGFWEVGRRRCAQREREREVAWGTTHKLPSHSYFRLRHHHHLPVLHPHQPIFNCKNWIMVHIIIRCNQIELRFKDLSFWWDWNYHWFGWSFNFCFESLFHPTSIIIIKKMKFFHQILFYLQLNLLKISIFKLFKFLNFDNICVV